MNDVLDPRLVRNGTHATVWLNGEPVAECYGFQLKVPKNKETVKRCRAMADGKKMISYSISGTLRLHNATSRMIQLEADALQRGIDLKHTIVTLQDDPDNPQEIRTAFKGVSFDDLTLADFEAAKLGTIEAPFTAEGFEILEA